VSFDASTPAAPTGDDTTPKLRLADDDARPTLRLVDVSRHYGKVRAVDRLSLDVPPRSFVTLLGPSGCGKSTTLSLLAGLEKSDGGRIYLGDRDITDEPPNERRMAMVFQNYALYPHMTAYGNIAFGLKLARRPKEEVRARVQAIAEMLDIVHLLGRKPGQLSGGQQQRVALGRALVKEPVVFLLDEPFSNLDAGLRSRMRSEVKRLHIRLGTTSVFVTHDQEEAMSISDLIAVMRDGTVVQYGPPREIYNRPRNIYVASFVGKPGMSLVDGRLEDRGGDVHFVAAGLELRLGAVREVLTPGATPRDVTAGIRAEDASLELAGGEATDDAALNGVVQLVEPVGSDTFVEVEVAGHVIVVRVPPDLDPELGETVRLRITPQQVHLFERPGGDRINRPDR
jgi:multiple sugar transport system ATP-binding protein